MFKVGDYVVYANNGVCKVDDINSIQATGVPKERLYYILTSVYISGSKVFTPVDNDNVIMRGIISKKEANLLIEDIENIEILPVKNEKNREFIYKESMKTCECKELMRIIKTVYNVKETRHAEGKKLAVSDEKYLKLAQDSLYGELAIPLEINKEEVEELVLFRIN
ncbi:MAG: CarD family transcriptional regulator [Lachnotalea sp.]